MKRILLLVVLSMFILGTTCFAADMSKEKAESIFGSCAGKTVWIDTHSAAWTAHAYAKRALLSSNIEVIKKIEKKRNTYVNIIDSFSPLEEAVIGIIDFDNYIVMVNKHDGTAYAAKNASNNDLAELFISGVILTDNPFDHGESIQEISDIRNGKMHIGFNKEQAELCWGSPDHKNKTTASYGTREQWVYEGDKPTYLYFENDNVTAWQN